MRRLKRFVRLTNSERLLLLRALCAVGAARASLWLRPNPLPPGEGAAKRRVRANPLSPEHYAWAVSVASRYVPKATCLTQALALQKLLVEAGHQSRVEIGVAKNTGKFEAHAWLVCGDQIVIGGPNVDRYSRLTTSAP